MPVFCESCVLSGSGLCVGLITLPKASYRVCCVCVSDREVSVMTSRPIRGCCFLGKKRIQSVLGIFITSYVVT